MSDRDLTRIRDLPAPDLWPAIERDLSAPGARRSVGRPRLPAGDPTNRHRWIAVGVALALLAAALGGAWLAFNKSERPASIPSNKPVTVSVTAKSYPVRCSATLDNPVIRPGEALQIHYALQNLGASLITDAYAGQRLVVRTTSGPILYDSQLATAGDTIGIPTPTNPLSPGTRITLPRNQSTTTIVRWPGPLVLQLSCPFVLARADREHAAIPIGALPSVPVAVGTTGEAPDPDMAIRESVQATSGLFAQCSPGPGGAIVRGLVTPPAGHGALPLPARCWAQVHTYEGFDVVDLLFVAPPNAPSVNLPTYLNQFQIQGTAVTELSRWTFVVTEAGTTQAVPIDSAANFPHGEVDFRYEGGTLKEGGGSPCPISSTSYGSGGVFFPRAC
ncbi:MAG TPA: hypothetical protein VGH10_04010 [Actinomycetota bacterium]|jgi:hypothetical protein